MKFGDKSSLANQSSWLFWRCSIPGQTKQDIKSRLQLIISNLDETGSLVISIPNIPVMAQFIGQSFGDVISERQINISNVSQLKFHLVIPGSSICYPSTLRHRISDEVLIVGVKCRPKKTKNLKFSCTTKKFTVGTTCAVQDEQDKQDENDGVSI